jgi:oligopeptidase A
VDNSLRDFRLGGAELPPPEKARFLEIQDELAKLGSKFSENVLDATKAFGLFVTDRAELAGIPDDVLSTAEQAARKDGREGWKLTLHMPVLPAGDAVRGQSVAARAPLSRQHHARVGRGAGPASPSGTTTPTWCASSSCAPRPRSCWATPPTPMSRSPPRWRPRPPRPSPSSTISRRARDRSPSATCRSCATSRAPSSASPEVCAWDVPYVSEKLRERRYAFSEQEVRQYFSEDESSPACSAW